ncbi:MAG TPA: glycosyltransferase [Anaerolineae bacterium]|nr:glycosyltransferase [Anaerolineae bacterium]HMR63836.1 glycosyltransferase [Anaerolineae bacterium]
MKVIITPVYTGNTHMELLQEALQSRGLEVRLAPYSGRFPLWQAATQFGRPDVFHLQWQHRFFTAATPLPALFKTLRFFLQWFSLRVRGTRFVWTVHNVVNHERHQARWELAACRLLARWVDRVNVHCPSAVPAVATAYKLRPERIQVVPRVHYAGQYPETSMKAVARQKLGLPTEARLFLSFGMVRPYKGLDRLLAAFAQLQNDELRLIIMGKPKPAELGRTLAAQAAADPRVITRFEFIPDDQLSLYLSACDLVVLPYADSLNSGAAVLAATFGRPLLMPKLGCMADYPEAAAITYSPNEPDGLRLALEKAVLLSLEPMGLAARRFIQQFSPSLVADQTIAVYQSVLGREATAVELWGYEQ